MDFVVYFSKEWEIKSDRKSIVEVKLGGIVVRKIKFLSFECRDEETASDNWQIGQDRTDN